MGLISFSGIFPSVVADHVRELDRAQTNFLVSIKAVGRALLQHMAVNLEMEEMIPLHRVEVRKDLRTKGLAKVLI